MRLGRFNRCRWAPISNSTILALKFDGKKFNLADVEKNDVLHKESILLDEMSSKIDNLVESSNIWIDTISIEWHPEGNLIACCDTGGNVKIYDYREGKVIRVYEGVHNGKLKLLLVSMVC